MCLYPEGKLAAMAIEELQRELDRQCDRQGALGDAELIDERAVEKAESRCRLLEAEIKRRDAAHLAYRVVSDGVGRGAPARMAAVQNCVGKQLPGAGRKPFLTQ